jgi:hypothetical protein
MEAHRIVRRRGSHVFYVICSLMAVRLPGLSPFTSRRFLVLISVRLSLLQDHSAAERIRLIENSGDLIGN